MRFKLEINLNDPAFAGEMTSTLAAVLEGVKRWVYSCESAAPPVEPGDGWTRELPHDGLGFSTTMIYGNEGEVQVPLGKAEFLYDEKPRKRAVVEVADATDA
jgi:hypothetical protein